MHHLNRLFLSRMFLPIWAEICLWFCASWSSVIWRLKPNLLCEKPFALPFYWRPLRFELDTTQYIIELVVVSHLGLRVLEDVTNHCLPLSFWPLRRLVMTTSRFLMVWLLRTRIPEKKVYCLSGSELWFGRPKDIHQASHSSLAYLMKRIFWVAW